MRRLLKLQEAPPVDGDDRPYRFVHPETAHTSFASDYQTWETRIKEHRIGNNLPPIDMAIAEDQLCGTLPPDRCSYEVGDAQPVNITFSFSDVSSWIKAVVTRFTSGAEFVEQAEAERRAEICVRCPLNTQVSSGCGGGCEKLAEMLTPGMNKRRSKWDEKLKSCGICHCFNKIAIHFPLDVLRESSINHAAYPDYCWRK